jgi:GNAT superfamily N-acetyltransferase
MIHVRPLAATDSLEALTELLHRAYKPLADAGMRFVASHQNVETTRKRCARGQCFVATEGEMILGTITLYSPTPTSGCPWYRREDVWHFGQFAVEPTRQGMGIGRQLLDVVEEVSRLAGATELALDTSEHATDLFAFYEKHGFRKVDTVTWGDAVNYSSVVMSKKLGQT